MNHIYKLDDWDVNSVVDLIIPDAASRFDSVSTVLASSGNSHDSWAAGKADELITHGIGSHLVGMVFMGAVGVVAARIGARRAINKIAAGGGDYRRC